MAYSKTKVDRAGRTVAEVVRLAFEGQKIADDRLPEAAGAIDIVEWWRREHAKPLSRVAANLRYYAADHGKPVVAHRLKKAPTISHKLLREPSMKLSRMADIGGAGLFCQRKMPHTALPVACGGTGRSPDFAITSPSPRPTATELCT